MDAPAKGQDEFSEWKRQEAEDNLPDAMTTIGPDCLSVTVHMSRWQKKAIAKARRKEAAYFRANPGARMFTRQYIPFEDGGETFRKTGRHPTGVKVYRLDTGPLSVVGRGYFTTDPITESGVP